MPKEIRIDIDSAKSVIAALKGILPANFDGMDRLVNVVNYLETLVAHAEEEQPQEVVNDGG